MVWLTIEVKRPRDLLFGADPLPFIYLGLLLNLSKLVIEKYLPLFFPSSKCFYIDIVTSEDGSHSEDRGKSREQQDSECTRK